MTIKGALYKIGLAGFIALTASGCGLFDTRTPQNPINSGSTFEQAVTPSLVLRNLESALAYSNSNDYRKCFSDTSLGLPAFNFQPSAQGIAAAPSKFADWNVVQEEQYIKNIFTELQPGKLCAVTFSPADVQGATSGDSVQFSANYTAVFPNTRGGAEQSAAGSLQFTIRRSPQSGQWYITSWHDLASDNTTSWSLIKARFIDN